MIRYKATCGASGGGARLIESEDGEALNRGEVLQTLVGLGIMLVKEDMRSEALTVRSALELLGYTEEEAKSGEEDSESTNKIVLM